MEKSEGKIAGKIDFLEDLRCAFDIVNQKQFWHFSFKF